MKRYISKRDDKCYTNMLKIINTIGGRNLDYNWLITEIEIIAYDSTFVQIITKDENIAKNFKKLYPKSQSTLDEK